MKTYEEVVGELSAFRDEKYRVFNERIINVPAGSSLGVRTPQMRVYAKALVRDASFSFEELFAFSDEWYEIRLLKCLCVGFARISFSERVRRIREVLPIVDGWAVCDLFCSSLQVLEKYREEYLPQLQEIYDADTEFSRRFVYVLMLGHYLDASYLPQMFAFLDGARADRYYEHMGASWLLAEILVRFYEQGVEYLRCGALAPATKRMAVRKACESYRISAEKKIFLKLSKFS